MPSDAHTSPAVRDSPAAMILMIASGLKRLSAAARLAHPDCQAGVNPLEDVCMTRLMSPDSVRQAIPVAVGRVLGECQTAVRTGEHRSLNHPDVAATDFLERGLESRTEVSNESAAAGERDVLAHPFLELGFDTLQQIEHCLDD